MASVQKIKEFSSIGREMGLTGGELSNWVSARCSEVKDREDKEKEREEKEKERLEREREREHKLRLAKIKQEKKK